MKNKTYHTLGTVPKSKHKISHHRNSSKVQTKHITSSEQFQSPNTKYHTLGTVPKSKHKISHHRNSSKVQTQNHRKRQHMLIN